MSLAKALEPTDIEFEAAQTIKALRSRQWWVTQGVMVCGDDGASYRSSKRAPSMVPQAAANVIERLITALTAARAAAQDAERIPREPTEEMIAAARDAFDFPIHTDHAYAIWQSMYDAALEAKDRNG